MSVLAGMMISIGCIINLRVGGPVGACLFAVGLASVILYKMKLFTGKAGLLATGRIKPLELLKIWIGNFFGVLLIALIPSVQATVGPGAQAVMEVRAQSGFFGSFFLAIPCGMLMYMAVSQKKFNIIYTIMCVAAFILGGFYHCVADMFYTMVGATQWQHWLNLLFVSLGNVVGCNIVPYVSGRCNI